MENKARLWGRKGEVDVRLMIEMWLWVELMCVEVESRHEVEMWCGVHVWCGMKLVEVRLLGKEAWGEAGLLVEVTLWGKLM